MLPTAKMASVMSKKKGQAKMPNSINTNVENRVNTGKIVSTSKDNGAIFAIASNMRADMGALNSVKNSIQRGQSVIDVALAAGDTISKALEEQKSLAVAIQSSAAGSASETAYLADFNALGTEITAALAAASFDGTNLFSAGSATNNLVVQTGISSTYSVHAVAGLATTVATATGAIVRAGATVTAVDTATKPGRRRSGQGKRPPDGPADQAAAGCPGPGHRQPVELHPARPVPLTAWDGGGAMSGSVSASCEIHGGAGPWADGQ